MEQQEVKLTTKDPYDFIEHICGIPSDSEAKAITWGQLQEALNALHEQDLLHPARIWGEGYNRKIVGLMFGEGKHEYKLLVEPESCYMQAVTFGYLKERVNTMVVPQNIDDEIYVISIVKEDNFNKPLEALLRITQDLIDPSGEGCEPIEIYRNDQDWTEEELENEPIVVEMGSIIFESM